MITLYGAPTTNVQKIAITLAELGLEYSREYIDLGRKEQKEAWFLKISPNNKIPVLKDDTHNITIWESGAILLYLADQYDVDERILAKAGAARYQAIQGAFFQAAHIGPNLGRLNDQLTAPDEEKIPKMMELFYAEALRLAEVVERMLGDGRPFLAGEYSIADIMHFPWLKAGLDMQFPALVQKPQIVEWLGRIDERPAVQKGMKAF